jgi:5-deoxy-glucuronate isomerase
VSGPDEHDRSEDGAGPAGVEAGVAATAPPNDLPPDRLRLRPDADGAITVTPRDAGWRHLGFRTLSLAAGASIELTDPGLESLVVPIAGGGVRVEPEAGDAIDLAGRPDPFAALPDAVYLPAGTAARVVGRPQAPAARVDLAIATAPVRARPGPSARPVRIDPRDIRIEVRGAGNATRQINHIVPPDFPADRLLAVEVLTPAGNWSSWPPHKHDVDEMPAEAVLEEVYAYRFRRPEAWAIQRLYRADRSRDAAWEVRSGEVVLVTDGYHPFVAAHGDDAWYLNALAGDRRTMACSFDPDLDWVRDTWPAMATDPRVPLVRAG